MRHVMPLLSVKENARAGAELLLDIGHRLVINRKCHLALHWFAAEIGYRYGNLAGFARLVNRLVCLESDIEQTMHGRHKQLARLGMDAAVADERGFDKEVRDML